MTGGLFITVFSFGADLHRAQLGTSEILPPGNIIVLQGDTLRDLRLFEIHGVFPADGAVTYHTIERKGVLHGTLQ